MTFSGKGITPSDGLTTDAFIVRPVSAADNPLDYAALMETRELLRLWDQSTWPEDDFTLEDNLADLQTMEERHRTNYAYGYTVMNPAESECLGCIYIFPPDAKMYAGVEVTAVSGADWSDIEATVFFWVRESRLAEGLDRRLLDSVRPWLEHEWAFGPHVFITSEPFRLQVEMFDAADVELQFELTFRDEPGKSLAYA